MFSAFRTGREHAWFIFAVALRLFQAFFFCVSLLCLRFPPQSIVIYPWFDLKHIVDNLATQLVFSLIFLIFHPLFLHLAIWLPLLSSRCWVLSGYVEATVESCLAILQRNCLPDALFSLAVCRAHQRILGKSLSSFLPCTSNSHVTFYPPTLLLSIAHFYLLILDLAEHLHCDFISTLNFSTTLSPFFHTLDSFLMFPFFHRLSSRHRL